LMVFEENRLLVKMDKLAIAIGLVFILCFASQIQAGSILLEQGNYAEETLGDSFFTVQIVARIEWSNT